MIDPRLSWFAIGATCSAVLFGWPWHRRFSRFTHENRRGPSGPPPLKLRRSGDAGSLRPTTPKPGIISKPQFPQPRVIPGDTP